MDNNPSSLSLSQSAPIILNERCLWHLQSATAFYDAVLPYFGLQTVDGTSRGDRLWQSVS